LAKTERVDQLDHAAIRLLSARPDLFGRQGSVAATYRRRPPLRGGARGKQFGPYYRLAYREDGRQRSVYLGRAGAVVERVRQQLATLQKPLRQWRFLRRIDRQAGAALRASNARVTALLRPLGLRLRGFQVRGWRRSPLRVWLPRRGQLLPMLSAPRLPSLPRLTISLSTKRLVARDGDYRSGILPLHAASEESDPTKSNPSRRRR
jgi:hypothetical protein